MNNKENEKVFYSKILEIFKELKKPEESVRIFIHHGFFYAVIFLIKYGVPLVFLKAVNFSQLSKVHQASVIVFGIFLFIILSIIEKLWGKLKKVDEERIILTNTLNDREQKLSLIGLSNLYPYEDKESRKKDWERLIKFLKKRTPVLLICFV